MKIQRISPAYLAGFFDGEGYVGIVKRTDRPTRPSYYAQCRINNTDRQIMEDITFQYGGRMHTRIRYNARHKISYGWYIHAAPMVRFLEDIKPYLRIKLPEVELVLEFQGLITSEFIHRFTKDRQPEHDLYDRFRLLRTK